MSEEDNDKQGKSTQHRIKALRSPASEQSLRSTDDKREPLTIPNEVSKVQQETQPLGDQQDDRGWSIWGKQKTIPISSEPAEANQERLSESPSKSEKSIICNPPLSREVDPKSQDNVSLTSEGSKEKESNWLGWRKPSLTSLRNAATSIPNRSNTPTKEAVEEVGKNLDQLRSAENDTKKPKERASSWSFWNNTQSVTGSLTNKILNGDQEDIPDAMLFESSKVTNVDSSKAPKQPKSPNNVVPEFDQSLPLQSFQASFLNNLNRLRYTLGFDVKDPKHLYRTDQLNHKSIKKILIIGIHGFFPTKVIRPLIGEPTGTSIKFANEAEKAVKRFIQREGLKNVEIQKDCIGKRWENF